MNSYLFSCYSILDSFNRANAEFLLPDRQIVGVYDVHDYEDVFGSDVLAFDLLSLASLWVEWTSRLYIQIPEEISQCTFLF